MTRSYKTPLNIDCLERGNLDLIRSINNSFDNGNGPTCNSFIHLIKLIFDQDCNTRPI